MKIKQLILFIIFILLSGLLFASSRKQETLQVRNNSDQLLTIEYKFLSDSDENYILQTISGIDITIEKGKTIKCISAGEIKNIYSFYPRYGFLELKKMYMRLEEFTVNDKLRAILKSFQISDTEGNILVNLDNLASKSRVEKNDGGVFIIIEINESDLFTKREETNP